MPLDSYLRYFLAEYLPHDKKASHNTVLAYGDTFRLLTQFLERRTGRDASALKVGELDASLIQEFLEQLENERKYKACSRNARLTAIRSFFRMLEERGEAVPASAAVLEIPVKRAPRRAIRVLTPEEMEAIIAAPNPQEWTGRRDHALLLTMYNTGARLSEITGLKREQVRFDGPPAIRFASRGGERAVPMWLRTMQTLERWIREMDFQNSELVFPSSRRGQLSSDGVSYILRQAAARGSAVCASLKLETITPHVLRHTAATHFLRAGIEAEVVARWLGYASVDAIRVYRKVSEQGEPLGLRARAAGVCIP